jgi:hypothetical protein
MSTCWRIQARHVTVCPRCRGYIKVGTWIVREEAYANWSHAVCPGLARIKRVRREHARPTTRTELKFSDEGMIA